MAERKLDGLVLFHPIRMAYASGFFHVSTERPMAIVVGADGKLGALVPMLERENIQQYPVSNVSVYPEYPTGGVKHPMEFLADLLTEMKLNKKGVRLGYDNNGYLDINGYQGPLLSEVVGSGVETVIARDIVDKLRAIKSPAELQFTIESCIWGNYAHQVMQDLIAIGKTPLDISYEASATASRAMLKALGPGYQPLTAVWGYPGRRRVLGGARHIHAAWPLCCGWVDAGRRVGHRCRRRCRRIQLRARAHHGHRRAECGGSSNTST